MTMSAAERKRSERERKVKAGMVRFEGWTYPELKDKIKKYADKTNAAYENQK